MCLRTNPLGYGLSEVAWDQGSRYVADPLIAVLEDPAMDLEGREQYQKDWLGQWMRQRSDGQWEKCVGSSFGFGLRFVMPSLHSTA